MGITKFRHRTLAVANIILLAFSGCSPLYIVRAGWEEARILANRQPLEELIATPETAEETREKLQLVLKAREFAQTLGLKPGGSYTQYSDVGRDVLIWVLSGSSKTSFTPVMWWFPIVGSVPYKGFFSKEDGVSEAQNLKERGLDIYLRPSPAFSTLGWFDDPLLSTVVRFDQVSLVDTVIHEILHNTIWIKDNAAFNETLANFVGITGAELFFRNITEDRMLAAEAKNRLADELLFAAFLQRVKTKLEAVYQLGATIDEEESEHKLAAIEQDILSKREAIFAEAQAEWQTLRSTYQSEGYRKRTLQLNNAMIIANQVYLTNLEVFKTMLSACGGDLFKFINAMKTAAEEITREKVDPYLTITDKHMIYCR